MEINKGGPLKIKKMEENYPLYSKLLAEEIGKLDRLPNFSDDKTICIMSDYGGEHDGADFKTYAFLFVSKDKQAIFNEKIHSLRKQHGLNDPYKEFSFKRLAYGPARRALEEYLDISNNYIHGLLLTVSIDKELKTVFGKNKIETEREFNKIFEKAKCGKWKVEVAEKLLRICHPIALFLSVLTNEKHDIIWMSDNDSINDDAKKRSFEDTQRVFGRVVMMYTDAIAKSYGFAKPFKEHPETNDLLSLTDFACGAIQEVVKDYFGEKVDVKEERIEILKWMAESSQYLTKVNFVFKKQGDDWAVGQVDMSPK
jgi:hypothetical protein